MQEQTLAELSTRIKDNLEDVQGKIKRAAEKVGRDAGEIKLVAVSKQHPVPTILAGIKAGIRDFGENYAESAAEKIRNIETDHQITWHMIGHIQSRKANTVCRYFDMIHSVDRMKIARYLDRYAGEQGRVIPILLEVNLSGEESKSGWSAYDERQRQGLTVEFQKIGEFPNLQIEGLMTMPPLFVDPEKSRPIYRKMKRFQSYLMETLPQISWCELSIGTSFDYEVAVEEGATIVRVGTDIFGSRPGI